MYVCAVGLSILGLYALVFHHGGLIELLPCVLVSYSQVAPGARIMAFLKDVLLALRGFTEFTLMAMDHAVMQLLSWCSGPKIEKAGGLENQDWNSD